MPDMVRGVCVGVVRVMLRSLMLTLLSQDDGALVLSLVRLSPPTLAVNSRKAQHLSEILDAESHAKQRRLELGTQRKGGDLPEFDAGYTHQQQGLRK